MVSAPLPLPAADARLRDHIRTVVRTLRQAPGHRPLFLLVAGIVVVIVATAVAQVWLNAWNQPFYNAIERRDLPGFVRQLWVFFGLAAILLVLNVAQTGINQFLRLELRRFATEDLIGTWMSEKRAARIGRAGEIGVNPDQRISADTLHLTDLSTGLGIGLLQSTILLASFIGVLWVLSREIVLHVGGRSFDIPGYMVWAALIYAISGSVLSWQVGRPLVRLQKDLYAREADLRFALVRSNEQADGIALSNGEADERRMLGADLGAVLEVGRRIVLAQVRLTTVTAGYGWGALVFPIIVAAPGYFGGSLSFGSLMMVVGAFNQVQNALRWFVDNTGVIADWRATFARVMDFRRALLDLDRYEAGAERLERVEDPEGRLRLDDLAVETRHGRVRLAQPHLEVKPGERVLILGRQGGGKSSLFLAVAGLWVCGTGRIAMPPEAETMYLTARPFVPAGSIREVLAYARAEGVPSDEAMAGALRRVGLERLALDMTGRWDRELTLGEQERLGYARLLLGKPKWLISDQGLDPADDLSRETIRSILGEELAQTAVLNIASTSMPEGLHSRTVRLVMEPAQGVSPERLAG